VKIKHASYWLALTAALLLLLSWSQLAAQEESRTVIGPRNIYLADGADALLAGDGEDGVRLTLQGLGYAQGDYERKVAHSNLCAGYAMINKPGAALEHCNWVLNRFPDYWRTYNNRAVVLMQLGRFEESAADIERGEELRPNSKNLKLAKAMLLDYTDPVLPSVEIDERRNAADDDSGFEPQD
jgi:tetratricopeptide (TPR) repeat protein